VVEIQSDYGNLLNNQQNSWNLNMVTKEPIFDADNQEIRRDPNQNEEDICKYCYFDEISDDPIENAKLYPCICKNFVHFTCL